MTDHDALLAALAAADPVDPSTVPRPDRQLLEEIVTMEPGITPTQPRRNRTRVFAAAAVLAVGGIGAGAFALADGGSKAAHPDPTFPKPGKVQGIEPAPRTGVFSGGAMLSCIQWDVSNLDDVEYAFAGTVAAIDNGWVSFDVDEWFKGDAGSLVVLNAELLMAGPDGGITSSVGEVLITEVGQRLLVSGNDGFAGVCNQTQAYTDAEATAWRDHLS